MKNFQWNIEGTWRETHHIRRKAEASRRVVACASSHPPVSSAQNQHRHLRMSFQGGGDGSKQPRSYASDVASTCTFLSKIRLGMPARLNMKIAHGTFGGQHRCQVGLYERGS